MICLYCLLRLFLLAEKANILLAEKANILLAEKALTYGLMWTTFWLT